MTEAMTTPETGKNVYETSVINAINGLSTSDKYNEAKNEWEFNGKVIDYGPIKDQKPKQKCNLCGHNVRYAYVLNNTKNGKSIEVGSECIENYIMITPAVLSKMESAKKNLKMEAKKAAHNAYLRASFEAVKVRDEVFKTGTEEDENKIGAVGNNSMVLAKCIKDGRLYELAKKYNVELNESRIETFLKTCK